MMPQPPSRALPDGAKTSSAKTVRWSDRAAAAPRQIAVRALEPRAGHEDRDKNRGPKSSFHAKCADPLSCVDDKSLIYSRLNVDINLLYDTSCLPESSRRR